MFLFNKNPNFTLGFYRSYLYIYIYRGYPNFILFCISTCLEM